MVAATGGKRIASIGRAEEPAEPTGTIRFAQGAFLDELPGIAFGLITLAYIASSLLSLL
ncbi:MAG: hypothetical protein WA005_09045 [Candidatus Binataceae bacterium]